MSQPANVMIKCPVTGENTYTGWLIDAETLATLDLADTSTHCERCHEDHTWGRADIIWETF